MYRFQDKHVRLIYFTRHMFSLSSEIYIQNDVSQNPNQTEHIQILIDTKLKLEFKSKMQKKKRNAEVDK